jgi:hypothetical protein
MSEDEDDNTLLHLNLFLHLEDRAVEEALPDLLRILRAHGTTPMDAIAHMLDPACVGGWKLELKRKLRGPPRQRGISDWALLAEHHLLRRDLAARGEKKPVVAANTILAEKHYGRSDRKALRAMASAVTRARRKYKTATGMDPPDDGGVMIGPPRLSADQMEAKLQAIKMEIEEYKRRRDKIESKSQRRRAEIESKGRARPKSHSHKRLDLRQTAERHNHTELRPSILSSRFKKAD